MRPRNSHRILAKFIDIVVVIALGALLPRFVGPLLGFAYSVLADGMKFGPFIGQSVGKKLMGLRVISRSRKGKPVTLAESAIRNSPIGFATFFGIIPVWGWILLGLIGIPLMLLEGYLVLRAPNGHRLGDVMADSEVVRARESESEQKG